MVHAHLERRQHRRYTVQAASRVLHDASGRNFPCQCTDISAGGACLSGADHFTEQVTDLLGGDLAATVVRVDREALLTTGHVIIAVRFSALDGADDPGQ